MMPASGQSFIAELPHPLRLSASSAIVLAAFGTIAVATLVRLAQTTWSTELGAHGPIVAAAGAWLYCRTLPQMRENAEPVPWIWAGFFAGCAALLYAFGRAFDFISVEAAGCYSFLWIVSLRAFGSGGVKAGLFPLCYLGFLVPPPGWLLEIVTSPLRHFVSRTAAGVMQLAGYPIVNEGVAITIGPYRLLVEEACAGMNSIVGLVAVTVLYIHLLCRASWRYMALLLALVLPIAITINLVRVIVLALLTYHYGDAAAQGFLHVTAGAILFICALVLTLACDRTLRRVLPADFVGARP